MNGLRKKRGRIQTLDFRQAGFSLFSKLGGEIPWGAALRGKGAQESWQFFKDSVLQAHEDTKILSSGASWHLESQAVVVRSQAWQTGNS